MILLYAEPLLRVVNSRRKAFGGKIYIINLYKSLRERHTINKRPCHTLN